VGKTVPSFRLALEDEIANWKPFREALQTAKEREAFDVMMDMCRNNASASGNACNPIIFEPMVMSILLAQTKKIRELESQINMRICSQETASANEEKQAIRVE
jgi:dethiobiotin synthetase